MENLETRRHDNYLGRLLKTDETQQKGQLPVLSSVYTTNRKACTKIFDDDRITAEKYDLQLQNQTSVPEDLEECVILFYGRPVFLKDGKTENSMVTYSSCLPCCLILNTSKICARHIFPFDINACPKGWDVSEFEWKSSLLNIPAYVQMYFSDNENYLRGICDRGSDRVTTQADGELWSLLSNTNKPEKAKTVEILCADIDLFDVIEAIIVPDSVLEHADCAEFIKRHRQMKVLQYPDYYPSVPSHYHTAIYKALVDYYSKKKVIKNQKRRKK